ncbi:zinc ribbon domain-containing protein [Oceanobacillus salinisoli]|uniref:zinc ribbon domain-containing protein n=1 Tax=Oceanobacillus salinisoli TaxID=2678611 RepID=UPI0012E13EA1|nr:zinc ribbon domain-containing protein [Oceanobacillus salinisoli]
MSYCTNCGNEIKASAKFCGNCGSKRIDLEQNPETVTASTHYSETSETERNPQPIQNGSQKQSQAKIQNNKTQYQHISTTKGKPITIATILVAIILGIIMLISDNGLNSYLSWGGGESFVITTLLIMIALQILLLFLSSKRKSYILLIPAIISLFNIIPIYTTYMDFKNWAEYQGMYTHQIVAGELALLLSYLIFFIAAAALNIIFLFKKKK